MKLIVGLGNPGKEYEMTRHNAGFCVMDALEKELGASISNKKFKALIDTVTIHGEKALLMKPQTYMNASGEAVQQAMHFYRIEPKDIIVIFDDMDLPVGTIRLREKGSAGGQKGMKNIIQLVGTQEIPRIRVGIGKHNNIPTVDYVLGKIEKENKEEFLHAVEKAKDAVIYSMNHTFTDTMTAFNRK